MWHPDCQGPAGHACLALLLLQQGWQPFLQDKICLDLADRM
jgi:hypothetical protein